jgi:CopG antitoxin of type II toxin-antitoxin system
MSENNNAQLTSISKAGSLEEISDFWDTHSLDDFWDQTRVVEIEIRATRRRRITLDPEVYVRVEAKARTRGILPETLVNLWLLDRLQGAKVS